VSRKRTITAAVIIAIAIALIAAGVGALVTVRPSEEATYTEAATSIRAGPHTNATNGQVVLRANNVVDASDTTTAAVWASLSLQTGHAGVYPYRPLTPSPGEKLLVANITVTNARSAAVPFTYTDLFIVGRDGSAYYANYAACNSNCSAAALKNRTLPESFATDLYVLFSVQATADAAKLVYASNPPIVIDLA
jgi:hypothetical protein